MRWSPLGHRALIPNRPITWRNLIPLIFRRGDQYKSMRWPVTPCSKRIKSCTFCLYITIKISARWKPFPRSFRISACFTRECARKQERPGHTADIDSPATVPQNIDFCCSRSQSWKPTKTQGLRRSKPRWACRGGCLDPNKNEQDEMLLAWNRSASWWGSRRHSNLRDRKDQTRPDVWFT